MYKHQSTHVMMSKFFILHFKGNGKVIPLQARCGPQGGWRYALLFHDRGTRRGWVVSSTPRPHFTPGQDPVPILQEAVWDPGPVWTGGTSHPHRLSYPAQRSPFYSIILRTETREEANNNTPFSCKDWLTPEMLFGTSASHCCLYIHGEQNFRDATVCPRLQRETQWQHYWTWYETK